MSWWSREGREPSFHFPIQRNAGRAKRVKAEDKMSPKAGEEQEEPFFKQSGGCIQGLRARSREMGQREALPDA